ncbi:terpene synthase family protein [Nostoc sp. 'Peltigera membranacea cyanobiont' N6]|uniref:terpene synthase family protein n=1 Tax=Nostoc sp. 'Peltigera membranacea cyanobiont' N6 TaxID=1261031 RepID=UPI000CF3504B|nr:terpene synthase [Nostoc sp. 'Peltigera membranacea cyanobiont' N6]AVH67867.1 terpene synthase [Nostoc sp. 'Peltigera membranacea cyanobiont' N6]
MKELLSSDLYCPFSSHINKHVDVLEESALEWVTRFNLLANESVYQRFTKSNFFRLVAGAYPYCDLEKIKIASDLFSWLFIWDDQCDMSDLGQQPEVLKLFHKRFIEILNGTELESSDIHLSYALSDLRQRMLQIGSIKWFHHFVCSFEEYFAGCVEEAINRAHVVIPDIDTYIKIRNLSSAGDLTVVLIEFCDQLLIPDILRQHDIFKKLKEKIINILAWCNDIFSYAREMASGDVHNLVLVLHYQQQIPLELAIKRAIEIHDREVRELIKLEASLPSFGEELDAELAKYISGMYAWIRGNLDWYFNSDRYQTIERLELVETLELDKSQTNPKVLLPS